MATTITIDPTAVIGRIHPWMFGHFVEHLGRCVYGGIYDPGSPLSDAEGFRLEVLEAVRGLAHEPDGRGVGWTAVTRVQEARHPGARGGR